MTFETVMSFQVSSKRPSEWANITKTCCCTKWLIYHVTLIVLNDQITHLKFRQQFSAARMIAVLKTVPIFIWKMNQRLPEAESDTIGLTCSTKTYLNQLK